MTEHNITTVQDMIDCTTEENLDRFLYDLEVVIRTAHNFKNMKAKTEGFVWVDDNKNNSEILIKHETRKKDGSA